MRNKECTWQEQATVCWKGQNESKIIFIVSTEDFIREGYMPPILSTCPLLILIHTNSGCGKREAHINRFVVRPAKAAPVTGTSLRFTGPLPADYRQ